MAPVFLHKPSDVHSLLITNAHVIRTDVTDLRAGDVILEDDALLNTRLGYGLVKSHRPHINLPYTEMVFFYGGSSDAFGSPQMLTVYRPVGDASLAAPILATARAHGITLDVSDVVIIEQRPTIDGMDAVDWLDGMIQR